MGATRAHTTSRRLQHRSTIGPSAQLCVCHLCSGAAAPLLQGRARATHEAGRRGKGGIPSTTTAARIAPRVSSFQSTTTLRESVSRSVICKQHHVQLACNAISSSLAAALASCCCCAAGGLLRAALWDAAPRLSVAASGVHEPYCRGRHSWCCRCYWCWSGGSSSSSSASLLAAAAAWLAALLCHLALYKL